MITTEQAKVIRAVRQKFDEFDQSSKTWTELDESMIHLEELSDHEIVLETAQLLDMHVHKNARCTTNHPKEQCFVPVVLYAIAYLVEDYALEKKRLPKINRWIMSFYLALSHTGGIIHD